MKLCINKETTAIIPGDTITVSEVKNGLKEITVERQKAILLWGKDKESILIPESSLNTFLKTISLAYDVEIWKLGKEFHKKYFFPAEAGKVEAYVAL